MLLMHWADKNYHKLDSIISVESHIITYLVDIVFVIVFENFLHIKADRPIRASRAPLLKPKLFYAIICKRLVTCTSPDTQVVLRHHL